MQRLQNSSSEKLLYLAFSSSSLCTWMISCCRLSGTSAGSTLNGVAKMFNSIYLLFTSLNLSLNASISFAHSPAYSSVVEGVCPSRVGKCTVLFLSSCTFHSLNLASNAPRFIEFRACLRLPWQGQTKWFRGPYTARGPDVRHPCYKWSATVGIYFKIYVNNLMSEFLLKIHTNLVHHS
jgi:hypothetical protein